MFIFPVSFLARPIVAGSIAAETIVTRYLVAEFSNAGSFVAEYIDPWFILAESIVADSNVVKLLLQGPFCGFHCCGIHCC